jgi:hypothetical protein
MRRRQRQFLLVDDGSGNNHLSARSTGFLDENLKGPAYCRILRKSVMLRTYGETIAN